MDIDFVTGLWTRISALLKKNNTKNTVSRNEPFSGHFFSFSNTCGNSNLSIRKEGKELAKQKLDFQEGRPKKFNEQPIKLAMNLLESHPYKDAEKMMGTSKSTLTHHKRNQAVLIQ